MPGKTEAQKRAQQKYMEKFTVARVRLSNEDHEAIRAHCDSRRESISSFLTRAAKEQMARDNKQQSAK